MDERFILVVDDDPDMARCFADALSAKRCRCEIAESGEAALAACRHHKFDAIVSDVRMVGMDGVELMTRIRHVHADIPVILVTAEGSIDDAVEAVKRGAFQYVTKPCSADQLRRLVDEAVACRARHERPPSSSRGAMPLGTEELVGISAAMSELRARIDLVAAASSPVLLLGETGTGKELVARAIHACRRAPRAAVRDRQLRRRSPRPCSRASSSVTSAARSRRTHGASGHFVQADGGTLFLDEIGDMPLALQSKLLRVASGPERSAPSAPTAPARRRARHRGDPPELPDS